MSKMFTYQGKRLKTWNPFTGCKFNCSYCWARKLAEGKLKNSYPNGFIPEFHPERLKVSFKPDDFVFVSSMGDIAFAPSIVWDVVINHAQKFTQTKFLLCTKEPIILRQLRLYLPNIYLGVTIESNRPFKNTRASSSFERFKIMAGISHPHKFISIEPIMDFDLIEFSQWIYDINPEIVEIGVDNYNNNLPEPSSDKVRKLIEILTLHGVKVIQKQGLERLLK